MSRAAGRTNKNPYSMAVSISNGALPSSHATGKYSLPIFNYYVLGNPSTEGKSEVRSKFPSASIFEFTCAMTGKRPPKETGGGSVFSAPGSFNVVVKKPADNTGDLGCSRGDASSGQVLTVN